MVTHKKQKHSRRTVIFEMSANQFRTALSKFNPKSCGQGTAATEAATGVALRRDAASAPERIQFT